MKLHDIIERRAAVDAEIKTVFDAAEKVGKDLEGAELEKFNSLRAERSTLIEQEDRAKLRDEIDRKAEGKSIENRATEGAVWALKPEQRMAAFHKAQTGTPADGLSVGRMVRAMLTGDWRDAEAEQRAMGTTVNTAGGYFVPSPISATLIDLARNASVMQQAGALTVPMDNGSLSFVRVLTDPTASWRSEGQSITASDASFGAINFLARSLAARCVINAELLHDVPSFAPMLDGLLASALGLELDRVGLYGNAVGEPSGIRGTVGVNEISMGTNGATPTDYDDFLDLIRDVELDNAAPTTMIWSPRTKNTMAKIVTGITSDLTKLQAPADFAALRKLVSNQVSVAETQGSSGVASTAFLGGFQNYVFGIRQQITIEASKVSGDGFEKNQVHVRAIMRADGAAFRPNQLGRLVGILA